MISCSNITTQVDYPCITNIIFIDIYLPKFLPEYSKNVRMYVLITVIQDWLNIVLNTCVYMYFGLSKIYNKYSDIWYIYYKNCNKLIFLKLYSWKETFICVHYFRINWDITSVTPSFMRNNIVILYLITTIDILLWGSCFIVFFFLKDRFWMERYYKSHILYILNQGRNFKDYTRNIWQVKHRISCLLRGSRM